MALSSQQRGRIFERFIRQILLNSGFNIVPIDEPIIYQSSSGLMLQGLAQPHNTDVLMDPPFQIPFFFPSRLIVECKCYKQAIGLPVIRNVLGLREDVNSFDIVTKEILEKRKDYRRPGLAVFNRERYFYQVAVASLSGFTKPAQEFALVHRIPLINIERMPFCQQVKDFLFGNGDETDEQLEGASANFDPLIQEKWQALQESLGDILKRFCIGILSSGDILFLYTEAGGQWFFDAEEIELHWADNKRLWQIKPYKRTGTAESWFELPDILFAQWAQREFGKEEAINLKERNFQNIYVMGKDEGGIVRLKILKLASQFIREARGRIKSTDEQRDG
jgi:hypothetical protein